MEIVKVTSQTKNGNPKQMWEYNGILFPTRKLAQQVKDTYEQPTEKRSTENRVENYETVVAEFVDGDSDIAPVTTSPSSVPLDRVIGLARQAYSQAGTIHRCRKILEDHNAKQAKLYAEIDAERAKFDEDSSAAEAKFEAERARIEAERARLDEEQARLEAAGARLDEDSSAEQAKFEAAGARLDEERARLSAEQCAEIEAERVRLNAEIDAERVRLNAKIDARVRAEAETKSQPIHGTVRPSRHQTGIKGTKNEQAAQPSQLSKPKKVDEYNADSIIVREKSDKFRRLEIEHDKHLEQLGNNIKGTDSVFLVNNGTIVQIDQFKSKEY